MFSICQNTDLFRAEQCVKCCGDPCGGEQTHLYAACRCAIYSYALQSTRPRSLSSHRSLSRGPLATLNVLVWPWTNSFSFALLYRTLNSRALMKAAMHLLHALFHLYKRTWRKHAKRPTCTCLGKRTDTHILVMDEHNYGSTRGNGSEAHCQRRR